MSTTVQDSAFELPLGTLLSQLARNYASLLSSALESCGADRYTTIMLFLNDQKIPVKQQYLADSLGIDKASMVRMLDYLTQKRVVSRTVNPENRREYLLSLTASGRKSIPAIQKAIAKAESELLESLSPIEREQFLQSVKQLSASIEMMPCRSLTYLKSVKSKSS